MSDELSPGQVAQIERDRLSAEATAKLDEMKVAHDRANNPLSTQAQRIQDFLSDQSKMARLAAGSAEARREWEALQQGRDPTAEALAGAPLTFQERQIAEAANDLRNRGLSEDSVRVAVEGIQAKSAEETATAMALKKLAIERGQQILSDPELTKKWLAGDYELGKIMTARAVALSAEIIEKK
jgi:hypothetical protein